MATTNTNSSRTALYKRRWWMLGLLTLNQVCNSITWISYAPVQPIARTYFGVNDFSVASGNPINMFSMIYMIITIPLTIPSSIMMDTKGLYPVTCIGAVMNGLGICVRYLSRFGAHYWVALLGQGMCSVAQPFFLTVPAKLAAVWFPAEERTVATSMGSLANVLGIALGYVLAPVIVNQPHDFIMFDFVIAVPTLFSSILSVLTFQSRPPMAPSASQYALRPSLTASWKGAFTNRNFLLITAAFGSAMGCFNGLVTLLAQMIEPLGYSTNDTGNLGATMIFAGIVGSGIIGFVVDRTRAYKQFVVAVFIASAAIAMGICFLLREDFLVYLYLGFGALGFIALSLLPVCLETACELVFPIPEGIASGFLLIMGQILGILYILVMSVIQENVTYIPAPFWFLVAMLAVGAVLCVIMQPDYRRLREESQTVVSSPSLIPSYEALKSSGTIEDAFDDIRTEGSLNR